MLLAAAVHFAMPVLANFELSLLGLISIGLPIFAFVLVVPVEAGVLEPRESISELRRLVGSFVANLLSTLVGVVLLAAAMPTLERFRPGGYWPPLEDIHRAQAWIGLALVVPSWAFSAWLESWVLRGMRTWMHRPAADAPAVTDAQVVRRLVRSCWRANTVTYSALALLWVAILLSTYMM